MRIIALILLTISLSNCKSVEISTIQKQLITPGVPSGVILLQYNTTLTASKEFTIKSLSIKNSEYNNVEIVISRLPGGTLVSKNSILEKGTYYLHTSSPFVPELEKTTEILQLNIQTEDGKNLILEGKSVLGKTLRMR